MALYVIGPHKGSRYPADKIVNTTSRSQNWSRELSPFFLGPISLYGGFISKTMENAFQYSKTYIIHVDKDHNPTEYYWKWAKEGWNNPRAVRYPMGKGVKPLYSYWDGEKLTYIEARKTIYIPLYYKAVTVTRAFAILKEMYEDKTQDIYLWDFDGYNHKELGMSYDDVVNTEDRKMGHAFVVAMALEGFDKYFQESK